MATGGRATATSTPPSTTAPGLVYSEILDDEQALTAARFWGRAAAWFAAHGITVERVLTDNGTCYRSGTGTEPAPPPAPP